MSSGINVINGIQRGTFKAAINSGKTQIVRNQKPPLPAAMIYRYTDWANVNDRYRNRCMFLDMMSDTMFIAPAIQSAQAFVNHSVTTYFYQLQYRSDYLPFGTGRVPSWLRAYHGSDIAFVFGFPLRSISADLLKTKDANFSRDIITLWTNFAKTG
jgi:carboxylesterase type B